MSLYEAVDYEMLQNSPRPPPVESQSKYEPLRKDSGEQNNYQQLNNHVRRSDLDLELQILRRNVRCTKIALSVAFVVLVCLAIATTAAIALSLQVTYHSSLKLNTTMNGTTSSKKTVTSFQECTTNATSCAVKYQLQNGRLMCNTPTLPINKTVSYQILPSISSTIC